MDAVIVGASGLVGSHLLRSGLRSGAGVGGTSRHAGAGLLSLDVTDTATLGALLRAQRPRVVFLGAAFANVDGCERDPAGSAAVNVDAARHVARLCAELDALMVFYSTDYIFDGRSGPYGEEDAPSPVSVYGSQKAAAERFVRDILPASHLILRTTVVYGTEPAGKNFLARLLQNLRTRTDIRVPVDQIGSPTFVNDLADASWELVGAGARGTFNVAGPDRMDRHAFALLAARVFGLDPTPIIGVSTADLSQLAARPLDAGLRVEKVERALGRRMIDATEGLTTIARGGDL
jgi:dTDP-4-dehydrorhamnose reductase